MQYESRKASSDVLKPRNFFLHIYICLPHHWSGSSFATQISLYLHSQSRCIYKTLHSQKRFPSKHLAYVKKNVCSKFTNLNQNHISYQLPLLFGTSTLPFVAACQVGRLCLYESHLNSFNKCNYYSYSTTNKMHVLPQIIYSCKTL